MAAQKVSYGELLPSTSTVFIQRLREVLEAGFLANLTDWKEREDAILMWVSDDPVLIAQLTAKKTSQDVEEITKALDYVIDVIQPGLAQYDRNIRAQEDNLIAISGIYAGYVAADNMTEYSFNNAMSTHKGRFIYGGVVGGVLSNFTDLVSSELNRLTQDSVRSTAIASYRALNLAAKQTASLMDSALDAVRALIGLDAGVQAASDLFPFTVATLSGIMQGVLRFKQLAQVCARSRHKACRMHCPKRHHLCRATLAICQNTRL